MKQPIRIHFFRLVCVHTLLVLGCVALLLAGFNLHEVREHPDAEPEERRELLALIGLVVGLLPFSLLGAWAISSRLVLPLRTMVRTAVAIRDGNLSTRLDTSLPEDELGQLGRAFNDAFDRYQKALDRIARFSDDAAHQLRNPLAAIRATGEVCLSQRRSPEEYEETLGRILEDAGRLGRTVDQLLTLARISKGQIAPVFESVDVAAVARAALEPFADVATAKQVQLGLDAPAATVAVRGMAHLLSEALHNLLDNALRHTPNGGTVQVVVAVAASGAVSLAVEDSGPGIPAVLQATLGQPYRPGHGEGHGLGLAIVADIAAAHESRLDSGVSRLGGARLAMMLPPVETEASPRT
jgi:signal transduction histidine kinase